MQKTQHKEEKKRNEGKKESCNFPFRIGERVENALSSDDEKNEMNLFYLLNELIN